MNFCLGTASNRGVTAFTVHLNHLRVFRHLWVQCLNYDKRTAFIGVKQALSGHANRFFSANQHYF
tara:strand:+ start:1933 stop:2127 length:195 start_codon:yes stop_codon:yes gene_type:complete